MDADQPSYVTEKGPFVWANVLKACGCDETSMSDWFALASASDGHFTAAMSIIHKLLKRYQSGHEYTNPSAFLCSSVKNAWHTMQ